MGGGFFLVRLSRALSRLSLTYTRRVSILFIVFSCRLSRALSRLSLTYTRRVSILFIVFLCRLSLVFLRLSLICTCNVFFSSLFLIPFFVQMKKTKQISLGFKTYSDAFEFIFKNGLGYYFLYPLVIAVFLFVVGFTLTTEFADYVNAHITDYFGLDDPDSWFLAAIGWLVSFFIHIITWIIFFYIKASFLKYLTLILLSPVLARVSQRTEEIITGVKIKFDAWQFIKDVIRGIAMALRNMIAEYILIAIFFFISFIPIVGWLFSLVFLSLISWFFYGFSMIDYSNERKRLSIRESTRFAQKNKWLCITNGFLFWIIFSIPWIGVIFAPITGIVAATIAVNKKNEGTN